MDKITINGVEFNEKDIERLDAELADMLHIELYHSEEYTKELQEKQRKYNQIKMLIDSEIDKIMQIEEEQLEMKIDEALRGE